MSEERITLDEAIKYIDNYLTEATHNVNGRIVKGNSLRTSFAAKDEIENRADKAAAELDIPKFNKLDKISNDSNNEMMKLFDKKYMDSLRKVKELSKSNDPKDKEEMNRLISFIKNTNTNRKDNMVSLRNKAKEISNQPHTLTNNKILTEGFIGRKLAKSDHTPKADTVLKVWCNNIDMTEEKAKKKMLELEKESTINQEISMPYDIISILAILDYPQNKFNKIAKKCENIDYTWLLWVDEDDPDYKKKKNAAMNLWKAGQYKVISPNGGGDYLIYSLRNGKFFDYFHESDTGENLDWLKTGVTYNDAIKYCKNNLK